MEAAIRWAPGRTNDTHQYLQVDVAGNTIALNEATVGSGSHLKTKVLAQYDRVPNFTAFDWSKTDHSLLALGLSSGEGLLAKVAPDIKNISALRVFPIKTQRKCNSITFSGESLIAVGLDRVRNDHCLIIYDINAGKEAQSRWCTGEAVSSVRFFSSQPHCLVAAVARSSLRLFDMREADLGSSASSGNTAFTKQVNNISIDPLDENYFASGGSTGDPAVSVWDRRWLARSSRAGSDSTGSAPVLELRPAVDNSQTTTVWSIRFSGARRGRFGVLSSTGEVKLYDIAAHSVKATDRPAPANYYGGSPWSSTHYISRSHTLQYPYHNIHHQQDESSRVISFDWVASSDGSSQTMLALKSSRQVQLLKTPNSTHVDITPRDDLALGRGTLTPIEPRTDQPNAADQTTQALAKFSAPHADGMNVEDDTQTQSAAPRSTSNGKETRSIKDATLAAQRTERWIAGEPESAPSPLVRRSDIADVLSLVNVHRRRCFEGYRFNAARNRDIVKNDPALFKLWTIIGRIENLAADGRMASYTLDLSFYGVHGVWHGRVSGINRKLTDAPISSTMFETAVKDIIVAHNLARIEGLPNKTFNRRMLCLMICGWCFSRDGMEAKCTDLLEQNQHYRAVALSYFQGHVDLSLNMLRNLTRKKTIDETGLGALLASNSLSEEQRNMCVWMEEDAKDPYLSALLKYLAYNKWSDILHDASLNLSDRLSVALRYLPDTELGQFIDRSTESCIRTGQTAGILLTGLTESCMDLFQTYIEQTNDVQTAVLATAYTNPLYVDDIRFTAWKETYLWYMQTWRAFIERTKFNVEHSRKATKKSGERLIKPASRQITLRCAHCNSSIAKQQDNSRHQAKPQMSFSSLTNPGQGQFTTQARRIAEASGTVCPKCGRHLPRCSICMQWLGTPEPSRGKLGKDHVREIDGGNEQGASKRETDLLSRFITFCASCGHGFHAHHAKHWFEKHGMCPVPDCQCLCGLKG
ncbi:hypothetical protein MBLNU457_3411t1 [Dothideomycetes sp. NU457]